MSIPAEIVDDINKIYDKNILEMISVNDSLAGKIKDEHQISNLLSNEHKKIFKQSCELYLKKLEGQIIMSCF